MHVIIHLLTARLPQTKEANYGYKYLHCHIARLLHISYQLLCSICQEKRDIDTCSRLHLHRNHIQTTLNNEHPLLHQD